MLEINFRGILLAGSHAVQWASESAERVGVRALCIARIDDIKILGSLFSLIGKHLSELSSEERA